MRRMTKKDLEQIRQAYSIGDINVENLVAEVEACWREKKNLKGELKACQGKLIILRNRNEVGCNV